MDRGHTTRPFADLFKHQWTKTFGRKNTQTIGLNTQTCVESKSKERLAKPPWTTSFIFNMLTHFFLWPS